MHSPETHPSGWHSVLEAGLGEDGCWALSGCFKQAGRTSRPIYTLQMGENTTGRPGCKAVGWGQEKQLLRCMSSIYAWITSFQIVALARIVRREDFFLWMVCAGWWSPCSLFNSWSQPTVIINMPITALNTQDFAKGCL